MNIGEKIKYYRIDKGLTQKSLGQITGIGEGTIRKYELGIRNPKPEQIRKIAVALGIGENILLDIPLEKLDLETIGDAMALFFILEKTLGIEYNYKTDEDGKIDPDELTIKFNNSRFNEALATWVNAKNKYEKSIATSRLCNPDKTITEIMSEIKDSTKVQETILTSNKELLNKKDT